MTTNREKLNSISNTKLAKIFASSTDYSVCEYCIFNRKCFRDTIDCYDGILKWLNK